MSAEPVSKATLSAEEARHSRSQQWVSILWKDIRVSTKKGRLILSGVSGIALPGEVIAIMGASAAGKTTLLNTLLHRNLQGLTVEGDVLVNGQKIGSAVTSVSAYVQQEDLFVGTLTVREHLMIMAMLKLPSSFSSSMRAARVEQVGPIISKVEMKNDRHHHADAPELPKAVIRTITYISVTGGEMKRLAFASKMLSNPPLLFCDEPTTGLDSHMAQVVVKASHFKSAHLLTAMIINAAVLRGSNRCLREARQYCAR
ncbi:ABC transporter, ATP-binding protein [Necator americanus]|uniref:ABC transporter, ATP-binding protein n=1 Tax=Necator americanus TaxID=51031 RepID=W2SGB7_NECAM|nr:ABC transporter, ATP-binding protein [Necator americanus]ETN68593.1 ABC transporter, ATP-binding protein [Necator americanus]